jgi:hypothetical protein
MWRLGWYLAALCLMAGLTTSCGSKENTGSSDSGYYYEGPVVPKDRRGGGTAGQQGGQ